MFMTRRRGRGGEGEKKEEEGGGGGRRRRRRRKKERKKKEKNLRLGLFACIAIPFVFLSGRGQLGRYTVSIFKPSA